MNISCIYLSNFDTKSFLTANINKFIQLRGIKQATNTFHTKICVPRSGKLV